MHKFEAIGRDALVASAFRMVAFFAVALAATVATAASVWSKGYYNPANWQVASSNILSSSDGVAVSTSGYFFFRESNKNMTSTPDYLTDGTVPTTFDYTQVVGINSDQTAAWTFPKTDIGQIRVFTRWADSGRDGVNISSVAVRYDGSEEWTDIGAPSISYNSSSSDGGSLYAILKDSTGAALAVGVTGLQLNFGKQEAGGAGYAEIEALPVVYCYYKSGVFKEGSDDLVVVDSDGNEIQLQSGANVMFDDSVAGANAIVYFGETLPTGVNYYFSDNWTGTVLPQGVDTATTYIWTGANGDNNMNTTGNWYGNAAPSTGAAVYIPAAKTVTIVNNIENFAPASFTFGFGSGQVTITGNAIAGIAAITNLSSTIQTFNAPVSGNAIDIYNTSTHCAFRGGITLGSATFSGANTEAARALAGAWKFTGGDAYTWTPVENNRVMDNSSVTVEGQLLNPSSLVIDSGCVVTAATLRATGNEKSAITKTNNGSLVVTGACNIETGADCYLASPVDDSKENSATVEFGSYIANNSGGWPRINAKDIIVGAGGISIPFASGEHIAVLAGSPVLHSRTGEFSIDQSSSQSYYTAKSSNTTTIDTTQYGTEDVPAWVTINARFHKRNDNWPGGAMNVTGCGTVLFNSNSTFTGGLTVSDTATVAVNPGKQPGAGTVTVNNGATLQVAQSGTVALAGGLTLADGAALGFNFTGKQTAPVLDVTDKTVTLNGNKNISVKVSSADGIRPKGGATVLTSGGKFTGATVSLAAGAPEWVSSVSVNEDGNIVLDVKLTGFRLIVK